MQTLRKATADFLTSLGEDPTHAVTLTFKGAYLPVSRDKKINLAARVVSWFLDVLNNRCFGHAYRRLGYRVASVVVVEGLGAGERVHCHLTLREPAHLTYAQFGQKIRIAARKTRSMGYPNIEPYRDEGWGWYITKEGDHEVLWEKCCRSNP